MLIKKALSHKVAVVVPVYKAELSIQEQMSLFQLQRILRRYPRIFVAPESLSFDYGEFGWGFDVIRFSDKFFVNVVSYSIMLLSSEFYAAFSDYEYILIYQPDAFVFSDRLMKFCELGYDYIGAPVVPWGSPWQVIGTRVGNGGFSLRRVDACRRMAEMLVNTMRDDPLYDLFVPCEDSFFGYCGTQPELNFHVAPLSVAEEFAVQDLSRSYRRMAKGWRPFGCHDWPEREKLYSLVEKITGIKYGKHPAERYGRIDTYGKLMLLKQWRVHDRLAIARLYGQLRRGEAGEALALVTSWLDRFDEHDNVWLELPMEMNQLYRLACRQLPPGGDGDKHAERPDEAVSGLVRLALLECLRRALIVGSCPKSDLPYYKMVERLMDRYSADDAVARLRENTEDARLTFGFDEI